MTGEASPGYLPYPEVPHMVKKVLPGPKIIVLGRNPLERSYSSYRYNYVVPTLEHLQSKGDKELGIEHHHRPKEYYEQYLYSFEQLMRAELTQLKKCTGDGVSGGFGHAATRSKWYEKKWAKPEFDRRGPQDDNVDAEPQPQLVDMDGVCYGGKVSQKVLRQQWAELKASDPKKVILPTNLHLTQALLGRSLYLFPLEWWYMQFSPEEVYFMCTEELSDMSGESMNELGLSLGLPSYNFSSVIAEGAFNVGGHRGYDTATSWEQVLAEEEQDDASASATFVKETENNATTTTESDPLELPLSAELRAELDAFIRPLNERLFRLTGRRCNW
jgi:hypothetical protein